MFLHISPFVSSLPQSPYIAISGKYIGELKADLMATLYDVGGIIGDVILSRSIRVLNYCSVDDLGGIITGVVSDFLNARAISSAIMMSLAMPSVSKSMKISVMHDKIEHVLFIVNTNTLAVVFKQ